MIAGEDALSWNTVAFDVSEQQLWAAAAGDHILGDWVLDIVENA